MGSFVPAKILGKKHISKIIKKTNERLVLDNIGIEKNRGFYLIKFNEIVSVVCDLSRNYVIKKSFFLQEITLISLSNTF